MSTTPTTWKPGPVETIRKANRSDSYRVRWTNPLDGGRYVYTKLVDLDDGEDFRSWLVSVGGRATKTTPEVVQGTWRGGAVETVFGDTRVTFGVFARRQIDARDVSDRTRTQLHSQLKNYFGALDKVRMIDIDETTVREVLASLTEPHTVLMSSKSGKTKTLTLAPSTRVHYSWFFWGLLTAAVKAGSIPSHPFGKIELPKPENVRRRLTDEEFNLSVDNYGALMSAAAKLDAQAFEVLRLILHTGLRIGEALALQVRHFDFENGKVLVRQQLDSQGTGKDSVKHVKKGTETVRSESERDVSMTATALSHVEAWIAKNKTAGNPNAYVFARPRCVRHSEPWSYGAWHRGRWTRLLEIAKTDFELPKRNATGADFNTTPHCLRHTFASRMLNAGMSVYDVSKLLGHKDTKVTERIYLHACNDDLHARARVAAEKAFPTTDAPATILRNGWYIDSNGTKKRRAA